MENTNIHGSWKNRKVLFIGDSLTARRIYPEVIKELLGIEPFYHCKGGAGLKGMVDGENGIDGSYDNKTDADGILRPLTANDVAGMDLIILYGGYNNRNLTVGAVGDRLNTDGSGDRTIAGFMQHAIDRIYEELSNANNMACRLLIVTVDCPGKYPWADADGYVETAPGMGNSFEAIANMQKAIAQHNAIPCCDLFHNSGINRYTWHIFGVSSRVDNPNFSPYRLDENGNPLSLERIRYIQGESYYQLRNGKVVLERYDDVAPYPYNGDQLHKSPAGYRRIGEVISGAIIHSYGI